MHVTRFSEAPHYEAPNHFDMRCLRLQGKEAGPSTQMWMGMSQILPGGHTGLDGSPMEKLYLVLESVRLDTKHSRPSKLMLLLTVREGRLSANHLGLSFLEVPRRGPVFPRPAPPHSCASHSRRAAIPTTKPAILRVFYIGTNNPVMPKSLADHSPC